MKSDYDVAIAGGGLVGLSTAWYLLDAGYRVTVIDAGKIGREASWAGGGILFPIYPWKYSAAVQRLSQRGRAIYSDFVAAVDACSGIDSEYRETGLCVLDDAEIEKGRAWAEQHAEPTAALDNAALSKWFGKTQTPRGLFFPHAAQVRNPRLCQSLLSALVRRGARVLEDCPVTGPRTDNRVFKGFDTAQGIVRATHGVVAAGSWSSLLLGELAPQPIFPVCGQMLLMRGAPGLLPTVLLQNGRYAIPRADGRILVGSTLEPGGYERKTDGETAASLRSSAIGMCAALGDLPIEKHWAGLRPATGDGQPLIGQLPGVTGLYLNSGQYRNGVLCAPSSAEILRDAIVQGLTAPISAFDPARL
ncbi:glycine oxidase ThiO [Salinisphaera dokdonensis CL-ES53]|uniref:Glycine oxidase ThiO n=1 Tax=Salinisphaera dokdonensis CL-ES53 TaxID=1304272 RepID=A0ABV2B3D0_9GAMM